MATGELRYPEGLTQSRHEYVARCHEVYWRGASSCGVRGPSNARCVLEPGHRGDWHEGNGFDVWGPKYRMWKRK